METQTTRTGIKVDQRKICFLRCQHNENSTLKAYWSNFPDGIRCRQRNVQNAQHYIEYDKTLGTLRTSIEHPFQHPLEVSSTKLILLVILFHDLFNGNFEFSMIDISSSNLDRDQVCYPIFFCNLSSKGHLYQHDAFPNTFHCLSFDFRFITAIYPIESFIWFHKLNLST